MFKVLGVTALLLFALALAIGYFCFLLVRAVFRLLFRR